MMLAPTSARSPLFALAVTAGAVLIFIFGLLAWQSPERMPFPSTAAKEDMLTDSIKTTPAIHEVLQLLYEPLKIPPANATFSFIEDDNVTSLELPGRPRYTKKLGKDILILDLETRHLESTDKFRKGEFDWRKLNHVSSGVFSHYTYAKIHGYDYKFLHAHQFEDRHATWIKPSALANHIKDYKFIIFLDADATFRFLHLPIEWMLNYWGIEPQHSITMALDPWDPSEADYNADRFNRTLTNTGFMVVQNNNKIMEILKAWHECPEEGRYSGCSAWKQPKFHEQSAFGEYIRYDYDKYIKELPCAEANGFPGVTVSNCQGRFVRHYWFDKLNIKHDFRENLLNAITLPIQRIFSENTGDVIIEQPENIIY